MYFQRAVEHHEQPALLDRLVQLQPHVLHRIVVFGEGDLAPIAQAIEVLLTTDAKIIVNLVA
jgi:hypothetical protein